MASALILGGGISGLSAAWFLRKKDPAMKIVLLEKQPRLGGCIATRKMGDHLFEMGPRTFQASRSPHLLALIEEVGLGSELVFSDPSAKTRYLWHRGRLKTLGSLWPRALLAASHDLLASKGDGSDESIHAFASRRFGKAAAELFFDPLAKGVFGGDIRKLSMQACFPLLHQLEATHRSVIFGLLKRKRPPGPSGLFTLRGGMQQLIEALKTVPDEIHLDCEIEKILPDGVIAGGRTWMADQIVSALPGNDIAKLCGIDLGLRNELLTVINLGYAQPLSIRGYGYLVPTMEGEELLGQIWDSAIFPTGGGAKVTSMVRGNRPEEVALDAMRRHLGWTHEPEAMWRQDALIPQYDMGHRARIERFIQAASLKFPRLKLVGNYLTGPSVEACIRETRS